MPSFGKNSQEKLDTCHKDIQGVLNEAINHYDFSVIWGHRGREDQDKAFRSGNSKLKYPNSKHNSNPSRAVDIVPYPNGFRNQDGTFYLMATHVLRAACVLGVDLRWGGHWRSFKDLAHFELKRG